MASAASDPAAGRQLGGYLLIRRVAVGGMAEIFEARRAGETPPVDEPPSFVVKVPLPQYGGDREFLRGFEHEARLNASLSHPNLVSVVEYGVAKGQPFLVMERIDGLSLGDLIRWLSSEPQQSLPPELALFVTSELLDALAYVHEATDDDGEPLGIVHRDVTPQNVLLTRSGQVRLGDFGIARSALRDTRTRTGVMKGKLQYMAPEQVTCSAIDGRADLYAAGSVLWELLVGEPFIEGESEVELLRRAEAPEYRRPSAVASVHAFFDRPLSRALARFPEERFPSAGSFKKALESSPLSQEPDAARIALGTLVVEAIDGGAIRAADWADPPAPVSEPRRDSEAVSRSPSDDREPAAHPSQSANGRRRWMQLALLALAVGGIALAVGFPRAPEGAPGPDEAAAGAAAGGAAAEQDVGGQGSGGDDRGDDPVISELAVGDEPATADSDPPIGDPAMPVANPRTAGRKAAGEGKSPSGRGGSGPGTSPAEPGDPVRAAELQRRLSALTSGLGSRGILPSDLSPSQRSSLKAAQTQLANHQYDAATATLGELETSVRTIRIDQAFVKAKLDRTNAMLRRARERGTSSPEIERLAAAALESYMTGRYQTTNRRLNQIRGLLAAASGQR